MSPKYSDKGRQQERQRFIDEAAMRNMAAAVTGFMAGEWDTAYMASEAYDDAEALWLEREKRRTGGK